MRFEYMLPLAPPLEYFVKNQTRAPNDILGIWKRALMLEGLPVYQCGKTKHVLCKEKIRIHYF